MAAQRVEREKKKGEIDIAKNPVHVSFPICRVGVCAYTYTTTTFDKSVFLFYFSLSTHTYIHIYVYIIYIIHGLHSFSCERTQLYVL